MLAVLDGSCRTPIAGQAVLNGEDLVLRGLVIEPEGREIWEVRRRGPAAQAQTIGREAGEHLLAQVPTGIIVDGAV